MICRVVSTITTELGAQKLPRARSTKRDCATFRFHTLLVFLTNIDGPVSVVIVNRPHVSLHECWNPSFGGDISLLSILYSIGWSSCFVGSLVLMSDRH